jgi:hypothetical protein
VIFILFKACLLQELYKASLFKIESVYNKLKNLREPNYQYEQFLTKTFNDKVCLLI